MSRFIAVDVGGTQLRVALFEAGNPQALDEQKTPSFGNQPGLYERVRAAIKGIWPAPGDVRAIGVSAPGPLDPHHGTILVTPNTRGWNNCPVAPNLTKDLGVPTFLENDANLAGLAEWQLGAARGHTNVLYLTISTGLGSGVIIDGRMLQGHHGMAAELGHTIIDPDGPMCPCGQPGHLEAFITGPSMVRYATERMKSGARSMLGSDGEITGASIAAAARDGDALANECYTRSGHYLGLGMCNFLAAFNPSIVVLGGGVSFAGELLLAPMRKSLEKHILHPRYLEGLQIVPAELGDEAGLLGAMTWAQIKTSDTEEH